MTAFLLWVLVALPVPVDADVAGPGRATWQQFQLDVDVVRDQFQTAVAPVIYEVGWATLAGLAMVVVIVMADSFAFKAEARGEALVPGGVLFVFIAALGSPRMRLESTALLIATGIIAVVALRNLHDRSPSGRADRRPAEPVAGDAGRRSVPPSVIAVMAGVIGPRIPGAEAEPLYETRGRGGGIMEVSNPLVDIRSRLVNRGNVELFRVNADAEAYWRLTTLPEFDGRTFRLPNRAADARRRRRRRVGRQGARSASRSRSSALGGKLLPAAADPMAVNPNADMRLNTDTSTLVKTSDLRSRRAVHDRVEATRLLARRAARGHDRRTRPTRSSSSSPTTYPTWCTTSPRRSPPVPPPTTTA